MHGQKNIKLLA